MGNKRSALARLSWDHVAFDADEAAHLAEALTVEWSASDPGPTMVVIDGVADLLNSDADYPMQDLLRVCRSIDSVVVAEGEVSDLAGSWPLLQQLKASRRGIALQPDQSDGDSLFRVSFPRLARADYPVGRGMYVHSGRFERVQVARGAMGR